MVKVYTVIALFTLLAINVKGQRYLDIINQAEKAVLTVKTLTNNAVVREGSGFLISDDGLAIVSASSFFDGDSVLIETKNARKYGVQQVLQVHSYANLALVKLNTGRSRDFHYLLPSKPLFLEGQEMVAFGHPSEVEDGVAFSRVTFLDYFVYLGRFGFLDIKTGAKSIGAPIINIRGEVAGIVTSFDKTKSAVFVDAKLLNDSNWINVNLSRVGVRANNSKRGLFCPDLQEGIVRLVHKDYEQSARALSGYIRINPNDAVAYTLRAHARFMYKNTYGCREDMALAKKLQPKLCLPYYFEALQRYAENKKEEAFINYSLCLDQNPRFSYALVEQGRLFITLKRNLDAAYNCYLNAIAADTTYGAGYYEKARFVLQHIDDKRSAVKDIDNAIRLDPNLPGVFAIRGTMRIESENYLQAIADFDKALEKDKNDVSALFNRGIANYNLGMKDKACKDWSLATDLGHYKAVKYISRYCGSVSR